MILHNAIISGIGHLTQNRLRAGLSILGIMIGIASVLCMIAIGNGTKRIIADDIKKLGGPNQVQFWTRPTIWRRGRPHPTTERYTLADAHVIETECSDVLLILPKNHRYRFYITSHQGGQTLSYVEGVTAGYANGIGWKVQQGRFLSENDIDNALQVCVLGANAAIELFGNTSPIGQEVKIRRWWRQAPVRVRVVGTMEAKGYSLSRGYSLDDIICVPLTMSQQRLSGGQHVEAFTVFFKNGVDVNHVISDVKAVLRQRHRGKDDFIRIWIPNRNIKQLEHVEKVIKIALGGIAGFSLFVSGISIMNMCLVSVGEKIREIGVRKSIGARRIDIFYQFLTESICLCLSGAFLGIAGGWFFAHGMARIAVRIVPIVETWPVVLSLQWILISVIFSIFMGVVFGVYPAIRAAWMSPIEALRSDT